jgi:hypothetical protein
LKAPDGPRRGLDWIAAALSSSGYTTDHSLDILAK